MYGDAVNDEDLEAMLASGLFDEVPSSAAQASSSAAIVPQAGPSMRPAVTTGGGHHVNRHHHKHEMSSKRKAISLFQELQKVCARWCDYGRGERHVARSSLLSTSGHAQSRGPSRSRDQRHAHCRRRVEVRRPLSHTSCSKYTSKCKPTPTTITVTSSTAEGGELLVDLAEDVSPPTCAGAEVFNQTRRKLRLVLSTVNVASMPRTLRLNDVHGQTLIKQSSLSSSTVSDSPTASNLHALLSSLLADSILTQDHQRIAQLRETMRCVGAQDARQVGRRRSVAKGRFVAFSAACATTSDIDNTTSLTSSSRATPSCTRTTPCASTLGERDGRMPSSM